MKHTVNELVLSNGAKGLLVHCPGATVMTFDFNFRAGEYLVDRKKWETPHLMEHILLGANEFYPKSRDFQAELERNGAYANATTGTYDITYEAECADFEWQRILGLLLNAISRPLFLREEFESEVGNVREELFARSNNHFRHLNLALKERYGFCVMTDQERLREMDNVTLADVREHYKRTHTTSNLRFVIAGNLTASRRSSIDKVLGTLELPQGKGRFDLPTEIPRSLNEVLYIDNPSVENLYFYIDTFMKRRMTDEETSAMLLLNIIFTETFYSRIFGTAREKGLVYSMSSSYMRLMDSSNFWLGAQVMPKNLSQLLKIVTKELQAVRAAKLSNQDVEMAKQFALGRYQRSAQTVSGTAASYNSRYFFDEGIEDYYDFPKKIEAVKKEYITDTLDALFSENLKGFGVLGSCGEKFAAERLTQLDSLWPTISFA